MTISKLVNKKILYFFINYWFVLVFYCSDENEDGMAADDESEERLERKGIKIKVRWWGGDVSFSA